MQWIKSEPRKFKTFVANRLAEIEEKSKPEDWRWVPTKENPADDATRGIPIEFDHNARWFNGPSFLRPPEEEWPFHDFKPESIMPKEKHKQEALATMAAEDILLNPESGKAIKSRATAAHYSQSGCLCTLPIKEEP
ncbi:unnamed protein product [Parnassius apollo]|uniref:(apollo) hypothetical protein n=1 Tax=Parnassius apollo TaxID=110799 RepID=A0A8S3WWI2_PARAO|nr:unnamed protein product [Parnassius apollo]